MENTKNMGSSAAVFEDGGTQQTNRKTVSARQMKESAERKIEYAAAMGEVRKRESAAYAAREVGKLKAGLTADSNRIAQLALRLFTGFNLAVCVLLAIVGYRLGIFTSVESLQAWVNGFGIAAPLVFIVFQAVQVVIPIIPGGVSLAGGVVIFGPWWGFVCNYIGICIGSLVVFGISRHYGKPLMYKLFPAKAIAKYEKFANDKNRFAKMFAIAIFAPCAPDDMLCYLAGTTDMSWKTYTLIILLGKPASTAMYSIGLAAALSALASLL